MRIFRSMGGIYGTLFVCTAALGGTVAYTLIATHERIDTLSLELEATRGAQLTLNESFETQLLAIGDLLREAQSENAELLATLEREQQNVARSLEQELARVTGTVDDLEKLTRADARLLQKYSKVFFLNEHYEPERLIQIENQYVYSENRTHRFHAEAWPFLKRLIDAAKKDDIELYVFSGYRSFNEQNTIKSNYVVTYGAGTANTFSADQGYSEHQLGTAVDFMTTGIGGQLSGFGTTPAYEWLKKNAHRFGFILSYPQGNEYYIYEPWHWRFVGVKLATDLNRQGTNFYDLPQREIDEYLINLFD
jgi:LAS superfamily LD-carboxypeptidase LdcB